MNGGIQIVGAAESPGALMKAIHALVAESGMKPELAYKLGVLVANFGTSMAAEAARAIVGKFTEGETAGPFVPNGGGEVS